MRKGSSRFRVPTARVVSGGDRMSVAGSRLSAYCRAGASRKPYPAREFEGGIEHAGDCGWRGCYRSGGSA